MQTSINFINIERGVAYVHFAVRIDFQRMKEQSESEMVMPNSFVHL